MAMSSSKSTVCINYNSFVIFFLIRSAWSNQNGEYGTKSALNRRLKVDWDSFPSRTCIIWHTLNNLSRHNANFARSDIFMVIAEFLQMH